MNRMSLIAIVNEIRKTYGPTIAVKNKSRNPLISRMSARKSKTAPAARGVPIGTNTDEAPLAV
jgi:hypothetical protein